MLVFLAGATAAYLLTTRVWAWYRLRHIKGPFWAGWTDFWLIYTTARCEMFESFAKLCEQYGEGPSAIFYAGRRAGLMLTWEQGHLFESAPTTSRAAMRPRCDGFGQYAQHSTVPTGGRASSWIRRTTAQSPCATTTSTMPYASSCFQG